MKYLCLIYNPDAEATRAVPPDAPMLQEYMEYTEDIRNSGHLLGGEALQPPSTATIIRVRDGRLSTTDGPFMETKEQLGGFYLIEARDLNDAIQVAGRIPGARTGAIEVRPVRTFAPR